MGTAAEGLTPRASSNHVGSVNVLMCDGSAKSLNVTMDKPVYARLLTPDGQRQGQILDQ